MGARLTALTVANRIIEIGKESEVHFTPMQVQKLAYFSHAWMLGLGHGPLFQDAVEAWQYGPVIRSIYYALRHYGSHRITEPIPFPGEEINRVENGIIREVVAKYGHLNGWQLSSLTHAEGSPWQKTYVQGRGSQIIHNHIIRDHYAAIAAKVAGVTA